MTKKQAMPYMKLYTSYLDDLRLNKLPEPTRWRYVQLYLLAFKSDSSGQLIDVECGEPMTPADIALLLRTDEKTVTDDISKLLTAGLMFKDGNTLGICRYAAEQVNQAEYRKAAAERTARSREKNSQAKRSDSDSEDNSQEKDNSIYQSIKVKSNNHVTCYSHVTNDGLTDGHDNYFSHSERFTAMQEQAEVPEEKPPSKPKPNEPYNGSYDYDFDILELITHCRRVAGFEPTNALAAKFDDLLQYEHVTKPMIKDVIDRLALRDDVNNPVAYLFKALKELEPQPCTKSAAEAAIHRIIAERRENDVPDGEPLPLDEISETLVKMGYEKPEYPDYVKWEMAL